MSNEHQIKYLYERIPFESKIHFRSQNNRLVSIHKKIFSTKINIHPVFLNGDLNILNDILNVITNRNSDLSKKRLQSFYHSNKRERISKIDHRYKYKNIGSLFSSCISEAKRNYDIDLSDLKITWGRNSKNRRRSIRFGSYDKTSNLVRLHPILDNEKIPDHFVESIIKHEIAHHIVRSLHNDAKPHSKEFKEIYKKIDSEHETSRKWEKTNKKMFFR